MPRMYRESQFPLDEEHLSRQETLFHNANGYLGVRGTLEEGTCYKSMRGMYINGFHDIVPMKQAEKLCGLVEDKEAMLNAADTQTIMLRVDGELFSLFSGEVEDVERTLDMDEGITERDVTWRSPGGKRIRLVFRRMASFARPHIFVQECEITPLNFSGRLGIESWQKALVNNYADADDPRLGADAVCRLTPAGQAMAGDISLLSAQTLRTGLTVCTAVAHDLIASGAERWTYDEVAHSAVWRAEIPLSEGQTVRLIKYTAMTDSIRSAVPAEDALAELRAVRGRLPELRQAQRDYLARFWDRADLEILGCEADDTAMRFNMYQLLQSAGRDRYGAVAAKGLSGEGYEGHYFWDTEMYMFPFYLLTSPDIARSLLLYRYGILPAARENARRLGHRRGALYPWRTIAGRECSGYFPSGTAQYHISGDIAYAVTQYWLGTGDETFMREYGAEILLETARLWLDTGHWHGGRFMIHDVTGPDEYTCLVNNNYYTNACAQYNLRWAVRTAERLKTWDGYGAWAARLRVTDGELAEMIAAADGMYLPFDEALGINPQDDAFLQKPVWNLAETPRENFPLLLHYHPLHLYRYQVCKQADTVLAYYAFEGIATPEVMRRSYEYYERITTHDSSLSTCIFSIVASRLGMRKKAEHYFGDSLRADLADTHHNTRDGIHTANMGGNYMAAVNGFAGFRLSPDGLSMDPFLPARWSGFRFRFIWQDRRFEFEITSEFCVLTLLQGEPATVRIRGKEHRFRLPGDKVTVPMDGEDEHST